MAECTINFSVKIRWRVHPLVWAACGYAFVLVQLGKNIDSVEDRVIQWIADYGVRIKAI